MNANNSPIPDAIAKYMASASHSDETNRLVCLMLKLVETQWIVREKTLQGIQDLVPRDTPYPSQQLRRGEIMDLTDRVFKLCKGTTQLGSPVGLAAEVYEFHYNLALEMNRFFSSTEITDEQKEELCNIFNEYLSANLEVIAADTCSITLCQIMNMRRWKYKTSLFGIGNEKLLELITYIENYLFGANQDLHDTPFRNSSLYSKPTI
jgi:hypothetical protein